MLFDPGCLLFCLLPQGCCHSWGGGAPSSLRAQRFVFEMRTVQEEATRQTRILDSNRWLRQPLALTCAYLLDSNPFLRPAVCFILMVTVGGCFRLLEDNSTLAANLTAKENELKAFGLTLQQRESVSRPAPSHPPPNNVFAGGGSISQRRRAAAGALPSLVVQSFSSHLFCQTKKRGNGLFFLV